MEQIDEHQEKLKNELDSIGQRDLTYDDLYKMTLWKVQRFPDIKDSALLALNKLTYIQDLNDKNDNKLAREALELLLECKGVRLPMASTYLRYRNPRVFQIIDRHVWYQVMNDDTYLYEKRKNNKEKIDDYFNYLIKLKSLCEREGVDFTKADSIYYWRDKKDGHIIYKQ